jgi:hypothetical protein
VDQRILVTQAAPGMELARPVLLPDRMVLVGEGAVLTDVMITQMLKRSIKRIVVRGQPVNRSTNSDFETRMVALDERFSRVHHIPLMRALRDLVARNMAKRS